MSTRESPKASMTGILTSLALLACSGLSHAATVDQLVSAAKKEGTFEFYATNTLTNKGAQELGDAFNKKYGLRIKLNYSPANDMSGDVSKVIVQGTSGVPAEWDVMVVTDAHHATLWVKKMHQRFDYKSIGVDPQLIHYDNGTVSFANQIVLPAYNTKVLPPADVPKKWEDLLDPKWKGGRLGMANTTHHLARLAAGPWGEAKTLDYVKGLAGQGLVLGVLGDLFTRLQVGEIRLMVTLTDSFTNTAKKTGAPIVFAEAVQPVISPAYHAGVPKGALHPNVGYLFSAFLTTPEAQEIWERYNGQSSAFVPGTSAYKYAQGKKMVYMSQEQAALIDRLSAEYGTILGFKK
ncbi:MAG: ABC transporter substrate-binding protein [Deltaproteobacteria bacterium]